MSLYRPFSKQISSRYLSTNQALTLIHCQELASFNRLRKQGHHDLSTLRCLAANQIPPLFLCRGATILWGLKNQPLPHGSNADGGAVPHYTVLSAVCNYIHGERASLDLTYCSEQWAVHNEWTDQVHDHPPVLSHSNPFPASPNPLLHLLSEWENRHGHYLLFKSRPLICQSISDPASA